MPRLSLTVLTILTAAAPTMAVVLSGTGGPENLTPNAWTGRFGTLAGAVLVGPDVIVTTKHQGEGSGSAFVLNGTTYAVGPQLDNFAANIDLRVFRITNPDGSAVRLANYAPLHTGDATGRNAAIVGFGGTAGERVGGGYRVVTYNPLNGGPRNLGYNAIDATSTVANGTFAGTPLYVADFDGMMGSGTTGGEALDGEATIAPGDSGGGWFVLNAGRWELVGLSQGVEDPAIAEVGDQLFGVRLQGYVPTIQTLVPEPTSLAIAGVTAMTLLRRRRA